MSVMLKSPRAARGRGTRKNRSTTSADFANRLNAVSQQEWHKLFETARRDAAPEINAYARARAESLQSMKHRVFR